MAMASAVLCPQNITGALVSSTKKRLNKAVYVKGLKSFGGLKASNDVISLGLPLSTEKCFAKIVNSVKATASNGKGKGGGALSSTCNAAGEIFTIAAIMNGLVLVGVAVGFVLLRVEAWVEESEAE
ncbi:PetM of cytochrome b6/f complex subunit 7 [Sesbania bispinosa]|nr:PetM of cytochrome b6/f complex subunit 7 [Sesbania bispinosa]